MIEDEESALARERELLTAVFAADKARMSQWMAPNGIGVDGDFGHARQADLIAGIDRLKETAFRIHGASVHDAGPGVLLVLYELEQYGQSAGLRIPARVRCSTVWSFDGERWRATFHQETVVGR